MQFADCILIEGSSMAEAHPVGFRWVMKAKERGAKIIHVDPRYSRTSALADKHVPIRAGTDIAFLGGLVRYVLDTESYFKEYVLRYTNAATLVSDEFEDTEDLAGLFSGYDPASGSYDASKWMYEGGEVASAAGQREHSTQAFDEKTGAGMMTGDVKSDESLEHPRTVFRLLMKHYARYTPEMVERVCGISREDFLEVARTLVANSGRERPPAFCSAFGWTQHTVGAQMIRAAAILQLLLGNIGRPGGGIVALRGHASIQGSTDIPTLYNLLPGYLPMPHAGADHDLGAYIEKNGTAGGWWGHVDNYMVSLLKAWWGPHAVKANDFNYSRLPLIDADASMYQTTRMMLSGDVKGMIVAGENPAVGNANAKAHRLALANLDWLVVRDFMETESAAFWYDSPEIESGELVTEDIGTEIFFMPAAAHTEKEG